MLEIKNLKLGYGSKTIIDLPNLVLPDKKHYLITGKSGSGKTTLLYGIAGLLPAQSGTIQIAGQDITKLSKTALDSFRGQNIGLIYQTLHMVSALTILENLMLVQYSAGLSQNKGKAEELLKRLGILDKKDEKPSNLSQGQQQRVAIARAAMNNPKIILGDEPTSALDDEACKIVMDLLVETAKAAGASLVVATHDQRIKSYFQNTINLGERK